MGGIVDCFDVLYVVFAAMKNMSMDDVINAIKDGINVGKTYEASRKS